GGERGGRPGARCGARQRRRDHGAVAAVHAVEIADGDDRAIERVLRGRFAPDDDEGLWRLWLVGHGGGRNGPDMLGRLSTGRAYHATLPRSSKQAQLDPATP